MACRKRLGLAGSFEPELHPVALCRQTAVAAASLLTFGRDRSREIDLAAEPHEAETVGQFMLEETAGAEIFYTVQDIDTPYFDLSLLTPEGQRLVILHSEAWRTGQNGHGLWERRLPPGLYRLQLTAARSPGILSIFWGYE